MAAKWYEIGEKRTGILLKITLYLVIILPPFLLRFAAFCVTFCYFIFLPKERANIKFFYTHLLEKFGVENGSVFRNFYEFSLSITDKIAVWLGKMKSSDFVFEDEEQLRQLFSGKRGKIVLVSHFGNILVAQAISNFIPNLKIATLIYDKNSEKFSALINKISKNKMHFFRVDDLDINKMLEISKFIEDGGFIGIMGDRVPLNSNKICQINFLGKNANFPQGPYSLARLLKCEIITLWCVKQDKKYHISSGILAQNVGRNECEIAQKYAEILEQKCKQFPQMWFNFFDFWGENEKL